MAKCSQQMVGSEGERGPERGRGGGGGGGWVYEARVEVGGAREQRPLAPEGRGGDEIGQCGREQREAAEEAEDVEG